MLNMNILYDTLKKNGSLQVNKNEFLDVLMPKEMSSMMHLYEMLQDQPSYKSNFFKGKLDARGLTGASRDIVDELNRQPDSCMNQLTARCTFFLENWDKANGKSFAKCLTEWAPHIDEESELSGYVSARKNNPDHYADILAVLYLYCTALWKRELFLSFLSQNFHNGVSEQWSFSLERAEFFADCGKEKTIFKTSVVEENGVQWLDVQMKFLPTVLRPEIPKWCSVVIKMKPARDIRHFHSILFRVEPVIDDGAADCGAEQLVVELHGEGRRVADYHHPVSLEAGALVSVPLQDVNPELLKQFEELCFVVNFNDLTGLEEDNPSVLGCHFRIAQIRIN
ncbi:MAG: hypothetical protein IKT31_08320 [Firmicutes bacterium]|nr:hypothetical protein [Bacillota bacterium]